MHSFIPNDFFHWDFFKRSRVKCVSSICVQIALLVLNSFADPISEPFNSFLLNPLAGESTAWFISGYQAKIEKQGKQAFCKYVGRISLKEGPDEYCPSITIWHVKQVYGSYDERNGEKIKVRNAICEYDVKQPGGNAHLTIMHRHRCPDLLVSMVSQGKPNFVGEWNLLPDEDPGKYFKKGFVEIPMNFDINPMFVKFMGLKYEDQLDFWYAQFQKWDAENNE